MAVEARRFPKSEVLFMVTEIAQIDVKPGTEKDFEVAVAKARAAFGRAKGFHGFELHRSIEKPVSLFELSVHDRLIWLFDAAIALRPCGGCVPAQPPVRAR